MNHLSRGVMLLALVVSAGLANEAADLRTLAVRKLTESLQSETFHVRMHAAEALIGEGHGQTARDNFLTDVAAADAVPIRRIGTWRVLAKAADDAATREQWIQRIKAVALDELAEDRTHAIESLGKLHVSIPATELPFFANLARQKDNSASVFACWVLHNSGDAGAMDRISSALGSRDPISRLRAAYVVRWEKPASASVRTALANALAAESVDSVAYPYVLSAAVLLADHNDRRNELLARLELLAANGPDGARYEACQTLMAIWSPADAPRLAGLLALDQTDSLVAGAWTILHLTSPSRTQPN